jgi:CRISPR-associated protein Cas1
VTVAEARIRYHANNTSVVIAIDDSLREEVFRTVSRARSLSNETSRPPVTDESARCASCSLVPVCLPEEQRFGVAVAGKGEVKHPKASRLFPADSDRRSLHILTAGTRLGRSASAFTVTERCGKRKHIATRNVSDVVLHGNVQISTQALRLCALQGIPVHLLAHGGENLGCFLSGGGVQRRLRQYAGLVDERRQLQLGRRLVMAKVELQLRHMLRASRRRPEVRRGIEGHLASLRLALSALGRREGSTREQILGHEGAAARAYFCAMGELQAEVIGAPFVPNGRSKRPPRDRFNALLSFGYALLYRDVLSAILQVGLEPSFGFLHRPRSVAFPLALDIMEIFRVPLVDVAVVGAVNRRTFDPDLDFHVTAPRVWLSESGRRSAIEVYERRKQEEYRHPVLGYRISYGRMIELEVRLLEKEWSQEAGLFGRLRLR